MPLNVGRHGSDPGSGDGGGGLGTFGRIGALNGRTGRVILSVGGPDPCEEDDDGCVVVGAV